MPCYIPSTFIKKSHQDDETDLEGMLGRNVELALPLSTSRTKG